MTEPRQLPLEFDHRRALGAEDFLVTPANAEAVAWIDRWPDWPGPLLTVWGPEGAGKSHLAQVFLARTGGRAVLFKDLSAIVRQSGGQGVAQGGDPGFKRDTGDAWLIDDFDAQARSAADDEALFHLFNNVKSLGGHILLIARTPPARWPIELADLRSRFLGSAAVEITAPDDGLLAALIVKHFSDRQLRVDADVVNYMVPRMDRTFRATEALVAAIDAAALARKRRITVPLVREILDASRESNS